MKINVSHVAKLANLPISPSEKEKFEKQLDETIEYIKGLDEVDTKKIEPTSQVTGLENITRDDVSKPSLTQEEALSNTNLKHNGFFKVDQVLEQ